jgi:hypothetical protein
MVKIPAIIIKIKPAALALQERRVLLDLIKMTMDIKS